jgi:hypothetical protein
MIQTRLQGCWKGIRRGAVFGAKAGVVIWLVLMTIALATILFVPDARERALADLEEDWDRLGSLWAPLYMVGGMLVPFGLMAMYGVAGGVFVMGIAGFLRPGNLRRAEEGNSANVVD